MPMTADQNRICNTIIQQFNAVAANPVRYDRRVYRYDKWCTMVDVTAAGVVTVHFGLLARKAPGDVLRPKVAIAVTYVHGLDLYGVKVQHVDGAMNVHTLLDLDGVDADQLAAVPVMLAGQ